MILHRTVRFSINPDHNQTGTNGYNARPSMSGLGRYYELTLSCSGNPDPQTGYLVDIHTLDRVARDHLIPVIARVCDTSPEIEPASLMPELWERAKANLAQPLTAITFALTPATTLTMNTDTSTDAVILRQRYEFSASHRLHTDHLDAETNRRVFGKCNNPNGHGHNYRVEPAIMIPIGEHPQPSTIDAAVEETIINQLDHKHLNADCPAFDQALGGVMPSVENIARFCFEQLHPRIRTLTEGATLLGVTVWETDRTSCTYPAPTL
ncbi:MAG: 6-carboxytetrahydropterin synthase [Phycisphaerales bacterium]|nr:6-carboxytetrahydropterin synthase [Phycisphaerales bacterium]